MAALKRKRGLLFRGVNGVKEHAGTTSNFATFENSGYRNWIIQKLEITSLTFLNTLGGEGGGDIETPVR